MPPFFLVRTLGIVLLFWAHAATTAVASPEQHLQQQWTLGQAVSHALANNPDSEVARQRIGQAQAALEQARASLYPHLSVNGGYTRTNNPMLSFGNILNQGQFSEAIDFNKPGTTDSIFGQIMLRYQLYSGGRDQAPRLAARYQLEAAAAQEQVSREQLSLEVVRAFHIILQAKANAAARKAAAVSLQTSLDKARARFQEGTLLKEEVLMLEVEQASSEEALVQARHSERLARQAMAVLLGEMPSELQLVEDDQAGLAVPKEKIPLQRPELAAMEHVLAAQEAVLGQVKAARYPSADAFASYQLEQGTTMDEGSGDSWTAGLRLTQTLFDGKVSRAALAREEARLAELRAQARKLTLALAMETEEARLNLAQETKKLAVSERRLQSALESTRLTRLRFQEGLCTSNELIDAEKRLAEAESSHALARHGLQIAIAQLRRSYGLPLLGSHKSGG